PLAAAADLRSCATLVSSTYATTWPTCSSPERVRSTHLHSWHTDERVAMSDFEQDDGSGIIDNGDGSLTSTNPDGSTSTSTASGGLSTMMPDGSVTTTAEDGTYTHQDPDG